MHVLSPALEMSAHSQSQTAPPLIPYCNNKLLQLPQVQYISCQIIPSIKLLCPIHISWPHSCSQNIFCPVTTALTAIISFGNKHKCTGRISLFSHYSICILPENIFSITLMCPIHGTRNISACANCNNKLLQLPQMQGQKVMPFLFV